MCWICIPGMVFDPFLHWLASIFMNPDSTKGRWDEATLWLAWIRLKGDTVEMVFSNIHTHSRLYKFCASRFFHDYFFFSISSKARCFLLFKIMLSSSARQLPPPHVWVAFVNSPIVLSMHLRFIFVHIQTTVGWVFFSKKLELTGMDFVLTTRLLSFPYYYLV